MIKRELKTDEQLYIDWASNNPDCLEDMPLNKKNLEMFKKTTSYAFAKMIDALGANELCDTPAFKALKNLSIKMNDSNNRQKIQRKNRHQL